MTPEPTTSAETTTAVTTAITDVRTELGRVDAKAGTLLGIAGVLLGLVGSVLLTQLHGTAAALGWLSVALYAAAAGALLAAVYPRLPRLPGSLSDQAAMTGPQIADTYANPAALLADRAAQLPGMARLAIAKYRMIQIAVWLLAAGVAVLLAALLIALAS